MISKPWVGVDPLANGVRFQVEPVVDVTIPGGAWVDGIGWRTNTKGTRWTYTDPGGTHGGITRVGISDRSRIEDGRVRWAVHAHGGTAVLPAPDQVTATLVLGTAGESGSVAWNPPGGSHPRCNGNAARLSCY